ncbi:MAG: tetratricopeptide repeat-containing sensor histidine kinase [Cyclobacteriaceae bacterium]
MIKTYFTLLCLSLFLAFNISEAQKIKNKYDSLFQEISKAEDDTTLYYIYFRLAQYTSTPELKKRHAEQALEFARKLQDNLKIGNAFTRIANAERRGGNLEAALEAAINALEFYKVDGGSKNISTATQIIALIYIVQQNYDLAKVYLKESIKLDLQVDRISGIIDGYNNLGEVYRLNHEFDSAKYYFRKCRELAIAEDNKESLAYSIGNLGLVDAALGKYDSAEYKMSVATDMLYNLNDLYPVAVYQTYLADIYQLEGEITRAINYANQSLVIAERENFKEQIRDANLKLSELYADQRNYKKAFEHQSQYLIYKDSVINAETIRKMADQRTEFEVNQKQVEVDLLNEQKKTQQLIGIGLVTGLSLIAVLAVVLYRNNQKKIKINQLLEEQKLQLEEINKTKDKFFSIVSHDLRGPVSAFKGISQIIKMYIASKNTEQLTEVTEDIDKSVDGLTDLLDNLLNWAVQQQGQIPYNPENFKLADLTQETVKTYSNMANAKSVTIKHAIDAALEVYVDKSSAMTIFRNLLNNSLKFTSSGGEVEITAAKQDNHVAINFSDTGVGISQKKLEGLFSLQTKERSWGTSGEKGLGVGLQLVYEFVQMNKGTIEVDSEEGAGTTFRITLPTA